MDKELYDTACAQVRNWLPELTQAQCAALRALFDEHLAGLVARAAALAECVQLVQRLRPVTACPDCASTSLYRHGIVNGLQRYRCRTCGRTFNALTNSPLAWLRLREKWLPFLQCMLDTRTVHQAAEATGIHATTSFRWRHRFLAETKHDRTTPLTGIVEADETYLLESQKGSRHITRPPRRRGGVAHSRGITPEHDCLLVARNDEKITHDWHAGRGQISEARLQGTLGKVIAKGATLVTDGAAAYPPFAKDQQLRHEALNIQAGEWVRGPYHIQHVNAYHSRFHGWLTVFKGVASRYLPNYLGWRHALDGKRIATPAHFLAAALGCRTERSGVGKEGSRGNSSGAAAT